MRDAPPRLARLWLSRIVPRADREVVLGDLAEEFSVRTSREGRRAARRWYWRQVATSTPPAVAERWDRIWNRPSQPGATEMFERLHRDAFHAVRGLTSNPGFSLVVVSVLSLGLGATTALFTLLSAVVLQSLPYDHPEQLVKLTHDSAGLGRSDVGVSTGLFFFYRDNARSFESVGEYRETVLNLQQPDLSAERVRVALTDPQLLQLFHVVPEVGRIYSENDARPGFQNTKWAIPVVISDELWRSHFDGSAAVVGRTVKINGQDRQVVGVLPHTFAFPRPTTQVWMLMELRRGAATFATRFDTGVVARLKPSVTAEDAERELRQLLPRVIGAFPDATSETYRAMSLTPLVVPLKRAINGNVSSVLWLLFGGMVLLLLIAATNVAALFAVRLDERRREIAVRMAIGAERRHIARLFLAEAILLTTAAASIGLLLARGLVWWALTAAPITLPRAREISSSSSAVAFAYGLAACLAGAYAALSVRRQAGVALSTELVAGSRSTAPGADPRLDWFLALQVSLALALMVSSALMVRTYENLSRTNLGFLPSNILAVDIGLPYSKAEKHAEVYQQLSQRVAALPGVVSASAASFAPLTSTDFAFPVRIGGEPVPFKFFVPGYFDVMKTRVIAGASFAGDAAATLPSPVLISHALARDLYPSQNPIGQPLQRFSFDASNPGDATVLAAYTVAGVVDDVREVSLRGAPPEVVYIPELEPNVEKWNLPTEMTLLVRTSLSPLSAAATVRRSINAFDPSISVSAIRTMDDVVFAAKGSEAFVGALLLGAACVALLLGVVGVYGSVAQVVRRRTREIGVRIALGADPVEIILTVGRAAMFSVAVGTAAGLALAAASDVSLRSLLFGVERTDPVVMGTVVLVLVVASCVAALIAGTRAVGVSPLEAMKAD